MHGTPLSQLQFVVHIPLIRYIIGAGREIELGYLVKFLSCT